MPDEKKDLNMEISVRAPEFATAKRSEVLLYPILGLIFCLANYPEAFSSQSSTLLILAEMSCNCTFRASTTYAQIYLHYQSVFNDKNS